MCNFFQSSQQIKADKDQYNKHLAQDFYNKSQLFPVGSPQYHLQICPSHTGEFTKIRKSICQNLILKIILT